MAPWKPVTLFLSKLGYILLRATPNPHTDFTDFTDEHG